MKGEGGKRERRGEAVGRWGDEEGGEKEEGGREFEREEVWGRMNEERGKQEGEKRNVKYKKDFFIHN
ncbi:hypothetical protein Tco_0627615 [Tanacetum coccineum]|uniref:Uncharacterized protein n=1 Tax=Tanacetum coccineum TaxID=301880 RepID=A0ABQ4WN18_9ASTR